jgi:uncharacterized protein (TIGR02466 family)
MMKKIDLYPSSVYLKNIFNKSYTDKAITIAYEMKDTLLQSNVYSVRNGWQSTKEIYNIPHFATLANTILHLIKSDIIPDNIMLQNTEPFISAMWLNIHEQHGFNHVHVHPGSWYSGVYYLQCSDNSGGISFTDPRPAADMSIFNKQEINTIKPNTGDLILFPSWLPHLVEPNYDKNHRISVSFNIELNI